MIHLTSPIYLNVEYSRSFVDEYPVCAKEKNIVMPYPTIDSDFYAGKLFQNKLKRDKLIFYLGGKYCENYSLTCVVCDVVKPIQHCICIERQARLVRVCAQRTHGAQPREEHRYPARAAETRGGIPIGSVLPHPHW